MIVVRRDGELLLVTQPDHAHFAARLLALRRDEGLTGNPRRDEVLLAVREHDNGWREADAAPRVNERFQPLDFREAPAPLRQEIWLRGVARYAEHHPYAALLIAEHAQRLHADHPGEDWAEFRKRLGRAREDLQARCGSLSQSLEADYGLLEWADAAALATLDVWPAFDLACGSGENRVDGLHLRPFPLAGSTHLEIACRRVPDRAYGSSLDLARTLAESRWGAVRVGVLPW
jgi:hypothetical protein